MALEKVKGVDQILVYENGIVSYREVTKILEDGVEISKTYSRTSLNPGQDLTGQPANVASICTAAWTPEIISAFQELLVQNTN